MLNKTVTIHRANVKDSQVEIRSIVRETAVSEYHTYERIENEPKVEMHFIALRDKRMKDATPWVQLEPAKVFYEGHEITKLANNSFCGLTEKLEDQLCGTGGDPEWMFEYADDSKLLSLSYEAHEMTWGQTLKVHENDCNIQCRLVHHEVKADNRKTLHYTEILSIMVDGVENTSVDLYHHVFDAVTTFDSGMFNPASWFAGNVTSAIEKIAAACSMESGSSSGQTIPLQPTQTAQAA
jgi:hypothetical protein